MERTDRLKLLSVQTYSTIIAFAIEYGIALDLYQRCNRPTVGKADSGQCSVRSPGTASSRNAQLWKDREVRQHPSLLYNCDFACN